MVTKTVKPARDKLKNTLREMKSMSLKVGYFADQGLHNSGMNYPSLMYLQEVTGVHSKSGRVHRRAFEVTMMAHRRELIDTLTGKLKGAISSGASVMPAYEAFCQKTQKEIQNTFGDSGLLPANSPATIKRKGFNAPLIETSDLKKHLTYRINKKGL